MSANILDGRLVSDSLLKKVKRRVTNLRRKGRRPKLVIILVGDNSASLSYIRQKALAAQKIGILCEQKNLPSLVTTQKLIRLIEELNRDASVHGILVQLPLPGHIHAPLVTRALNPQKDVDGFHAYNLGKMLLSLDFENMAPCTPKGILALLDFYRISLQGKHVVVIGRSNIVGKPLAIMLINRDATVTVCHSRTKNLAQYTRMADILMVAVGKPKMVKAAMVKKGAVVIDVGVSKVDNKLTGDVDFEGVMKKASWITPVPGGVGPMTVACLMENVVRAAKK